MTPLTVPPDYETYKEVLYFKTSIFSSNDSSEARQALLSRPKLKCTFTATAARSQDINLLRGLVYRNDEVVMCPIWSQAQILDYSSSSPSSTIYIPEQSVLKVGDDVLLTDEMIGGEYLGYAKVVEVHSSNIKVDKAFSVSKGTLFAPYRKGKINATISSKNTVGMLEAFNITFEEF